MKKLLLLITALFLLVSVDGQILRYSNYTAPTPPPEEPIGTEPPASWSTDAYGWYTLYENSFTKDGNNYITTWSDSLGSGHNLTYYSGTATSTPKWTADSVTFDGIDDELRCYEDDASLGTAFTVYIVVNRLTWTSTKRLFAGYNNYPMIWLYDNTPEVDVRSSSTYGDLALGGMADNTFAVICAVFNGASSGLQVNNGTFTTVSLNADDPGGLMFGTAGSHSNFFNGKYKEIVVVDNADDETTRNAGIAYLMARHGIE